MSTNEKTILVVEDESPLSSAIQVALKPEGFNIELANDGQIALSILKESTIDLVILDMYLPKMEGLEFLEEKKKLNNTVPTIVLSNISEGDEMAKARSLGIEGYYVKADTSIADLVKIVKKMLGES